MHALVNSESEEHGTEHPSMRKEGERNVSELGEIKIDWKRPPTLAELKADFEEAADYQRTHIATIDKWLDELFVRGTVKRKKKKGRSSVTPKLIRKLAEWRYASLSEPFTGPKRLFKASPVTWDDQKAAEQNELILNHQFNFRIDRGTFIDEYVRAATNQGTVVVRVGWEFEESKVEREVPIYDLVPDPAFAETIQEVAALQISNPNAFEYDVPEELKDAVLQSIEQQIPLRPNITGSEVITEMRTKVNQPTLEVCNLKNIFIDPTCNGNIKKANFIIYSYESSKADLKKDGRYQNLDAVNVASQSVLGEPDHSATDGAANFTFHDDARKRFVVNEYWGFLDVNGDGVLVSVVIAWTGNTILWMAENPFPDKELPFVLVKFMPREKEIYGEPDAELLSEHQEIMGAVTRGMIDIMGRSANGQTGVRRDMLDATNKRRFRLGEDYEFNGNVDPNQGFFMHKFNEIPNSAQFMLQLQNAEAESLTGVKAFSAGLNSDALGEVATSVRGVLDSASKRELGILRRLASGIIQIGRKVSAMNGEFLSETEVVRLTNEKFIPVRRDELNGEFDLELTISTAEEDDAKAKELGFMMQTMGNNVDFGVTQKILSKMFTLRKMPELAEVIERYEPKPDPMQQQIQQLEIQKLQAEIAQIQSQAEENQAEAELDRARAENVSADTDKKALDFVEQESGTTQERELQKLGEQSRGNMALEQLKQATSADASKPDPEQENLRALEETLLSEYIKTNRPQPAANS